MQACHRPERALHIGAVCLLRKAAGVAAVLATLCTCQAVHHCTAWWRHARALAEWRLDNAALCRIPAAGQGG